MYRLGSRLLLAFFVVVLTAVGTVSIFVTRRAETEFAEYEAASERLQRTRMAQWLEGYYERDDTWDGVQPYTEEMDALSGVGVIIVDASGQLVAESRDRNGADAIPPDWHALPLKTGVGSSVGTLYMSSERTIQEQFRAKLQDSLWFVLLGGSIVAILAALGVSSAVTSMIARPIREISEVARRAGSGDFSKRVAVRSRDEVGELGQTFNKMASELEAALQQRRNQIADTAHELRSPLTNIRGYLEALEDGLMDVNSSIPVVKEEVGLLTRLVDDLQELALVESGAVTLHRTRESVKGLIERTVASYRFMASERGVSLLSVLPDELPYVIADDQRISQVLSNLLRNAIQHTPPGETVELSAENKRGFVEVSIADAGQGIPEEELTRVFERFRRLDPSRSRATGGSGLGLTIARILVELHGGQIQAVSRPTGGTRFSFSLPVWDG